MVKIYCLIDPFTKKVFYVGATSQPLHKRLLSHISENIKSVFTGIKRVKQLKILELLAKGKKPIIRLLAETTENNSAKFETKYYNYYTERGIKLLQSKRQILPRITKKDKAILQKMDVVLSDTPVKSKNEIVNKYNDLLPYEKTLLVYIANGLTSKQIGKILGKSNRTIETRIQYIRNAFLASNLPHLVSICFKANILK